MTFRGTRKAQVWRLRLPGSGHLIQHRGFEFGSGTEAWGGERGRREGGEEFQEQVEERFGGSVPPSGLAAWLRAWAGRPGGLAGLSGCGSSLVSWPSLAFCRSASSH